MSATLKMMAWSNSRKSSPVSFLIFSRRYTSVLRWTNSLREVSDTFRLFKKNPIEALDQETLYTINKFFENNLNVSIGFFLNTSLRNISQSVVGS